MYIYIVIKECKKYVTVMDTRIVRYSFLFLLSFKKLNHTRTMLIFD